MAADEGQVNHMLMENGLQKLGIGYENYKEFIDEGLYYIDKTLLIRDVLRIGGKVTLFTRPRRFGKTLAQSMLRTFFEAETDRDGNPVDNSRYFEGMKIMECGDEILSRMGKYPVIRMSLKSAKQPDFRGAFIRLREEIVSEFIRHLYLEKSDKLDDDHRKLFSDFCRGNSEWDKQSRSFKNDEGEAALRTEVSRYATAIKTLSECLKLHHGTNVVILIDEYDVPLENAYHEGFYSEMVGFIRSLFESCLKTNDCLEFAVITGCLRISKESIFTGLNHFMINSITGEGFSEGFGFTPEETQQLLTDYRLSDKIREVHEWYDGYLFGGTEIYNPWSVIYYVYGKVVEKYEFPRPYWANTSSNDIIRKLVEYSNDEQKKELDTLINGGTIEKQIHEDITYAEIDYTRPDDNLWNFMFFTGYLKKVSERRDDNGNVYMTMCIPNKEIRLIYINHIRSWFDDIVRNTDRNILYQNVKDKDTEGMAEFVSVLLEKSISTFDHDESFYHGYLLSLLTEMPGYHARSNREEGDGRPDIVLYPARPRDPAYIFEIKRVDKFNQMSGGIEEAFRQITEKRYEEGVLDDGYAGVVSYGVCFCKKACIMELYKPG